MLFKRDKHRKLRLLLKKSNPNMKITITDNKDGSQTITILWPIKSLMYHFIPLLPLKSIINVLINVYVLFI